MDNGYSVCHSFLMDLLIFKDLCAQCNVHLYFVHSALNLIRDVLSNLFKINRELVSDRTPGFTSLLSEDNILSLKQHNQSLYILLI